MGRVLSRLKSVDFYKKIPSDLTEATLAGAWISIVAAVLIVFLLGAELMSFLSTKTTSELVIDRSAQTELLRINFNMSFMALSCEFATLDVSDALGTKRVNITKTVAKTPIDLDLQRAGHSTIDVAKPGPKYDEEGSMEVDDIDVTIPITQANFASTLGRYPIVVVNFFAPWCHWCQRLAPTWEAATQEVHTKYPEWDGRIRFAKVDCTADVELCRAHFITGFPSIRVFRSGHDDITVGGHQEHEAYIGDRTKEALVAFADSLVPSAGQPHRRHASLQAVVKTHGCNMAGFVLVKKVPGTLHFHANAEGHSFDHTWMNMSHFMHSFHFGVPPTPRTLHELRKLHPLGLNTDWMDKLQTQMFMSESVQSTHEHYLKVVLTTVEPKGRKKQEALYDAYEYTVASHTYTSDAIPAAKFSYDLSPIQIVVREEGRPWYHFLTTLCAIIGGVFTVAGILDGILYQGIKLAKKVQLGKQG